MNTFIPYKLHFQNENILACKNRFIKNINICIPMAYCLERVGYAVSSNDSKKLIKRIYSFVDTTSFSFAFPGWHAVTLLKRHFVDLLNRDYFVCEKSDGIRALLYIMSEREKTHFFLIDRKNSCYKISSKKPVFLEQDYLFDGEILITNTDKVKYSVFDTILFQNHSVMHLNLLERLRLADKFIKRCLRNLFDFDVLVKKMYKAYGFAEAYETRHSLEHKNDGLIFTCVEEPYVFGTCNTLYKWKPPSLNTIDFEMKNEFEDIYSLWCPGKNKKMVKIGYYFDFFIGDGEDSDKEEKRIEGSDTIKHENTDQEPATHPLNNVNTANIRDDVSNEINTTDTYDSGRVKRTKIDQNIQNGKNIFSDKYHNKIGEFFYDINKKSICLDDYSIVRGKWELLKIREDKNTPNSYKVVSNIFTSMKENITYEEIVKYFDDIRINWKAREAAGKKS